MSMSHQTQAVLLLTAHFSRVPKDEPRPLTPTEWGRFARWLKDHAVSPETLVTNDPAIVLDGWSDPKITLERVQFLLGRAGALGLAMEKWERAGLWVLTRAHPAYPHRLKQLLQENAPALLFGSGNADLLQQGGVAIIGSRAATETDLSFTARLGREAAPQGLSIISGGARGVDEAAMLSALEHDGTAVGILSDGLLRATTAAKFRPALQANRLVLVSPFHPEAGFDVGNAMARNKYIYCLADAAIVITTSKGTGGTWNGALENLRQGWVPLWVKPHEDQGSGNVALVEKGAHWLSAGPLRLATLVARSPSPPMPQAENQPSLFDDRTFEIVSPPQTIPSEVLIG